MIIQRIKPYIQPEFNRPTLSLNDMKVTVNNPEANGDFATMFDIYVDGNLFYAAPIVDNSFSTDFIGLETGKLHSFVARVRATETIRASAESNVEVAGKLAQPVLTIEGDNLVISNAGDVTAFDVYVNGEYFTTTTDTSIKISDLINVGYNRFKVLSKNENDTRWVNSNLSNEVKRLENDVLTLAVGRNAMASGTVGNIAVFAGGDIYTTSGRSGVVEAYDETLTHIIAAVDLIEYDLLYNGTPLTANAGDYLIIKGKEIYGALDENLTLQTLSNPTTEGCFAGSIGNSAIFAGGRKSGKDVSDAFYFDGNLSSVTLEPLSTARACGGSSNTRNHLVFCGGLSSQSADAYDEDFILVSVANMPRAKAYLIGANAGNYAVFVGGGANSSSFSAEGFAYDENLVLNAIMNLTEPRCKCSAVSCNGSAVFSGSSFDEFTDVVEIYSDELVKTNRNIPIAKTYVAMASINELCLIAGGIYPTDDYKATSNTVDVLIFD